MRDVPSVISISGIHGPFAVDWSRSKKNHAWSKIIYSISWPTLSTPSPMRWLKDWIQRYKRSSRMLEVIAHSRASETAYFSTAGAWKWFHSIHTLLRRTHNLGLSPNEKEAYYWVTFNSMDRKGWPLQTVQRTPSAPLPWGVKTAYSASQLKVSKPALTYTHWSRAPKRTDWNRMLTSGACSPNYHRLKQSQPSKHSYRVSLTKTWWSIKVQPWGLFCAYKQCRVLWMSRDFTIKTGDILVRTECRQTKCITIYLQDCQWLY